MLKNCLAFLFLAVALSQFNLIKGQLPCPSGWTTNMNTASCYKIGNPLLDRDWDKARASCKAVGGDLVSLLDADEKNYFKSFLSVVFNKNFAFWTSGRIREVDNQWIWFDNNKYVNKTMVQLNEQNDGKCLKLGFINDELVLTNDNCGASIPFICKQPFGASTGCNIDEKWDPVDGNCIKIFAENTNWQDARQKCQSQGGDLTVVKGPATQTYLGNWHDVNKYPLWLGLSDRTQNPGELHWIDDHFTIPTDYWQPGQPKLSPASDDPNMGNCVAINYPRYGLWGVQNCSEPSAYACQKNQGECPAGWVPFRNKCYFINSNTINHASWYEAEQACKNYAGNLVAIDDFPELYFINREVKDSISSSDFWLGLSTFDNVYKWTTGNPIGDITNWLDNEPNTDQNRDNCVIISNEKGKWYTSSNCFRKLPYICERDLGLPLEPAQSNIEIYGGNSDKQFCIFPFVYRNQTYYQCITNDRPAYWCATTSNYDQKAEWGFCKNVGVCEPGWKEFDKKCYKYFNDLSRKEINWQGARDFCSTQGTGASLASIKNSRTQIFIDNLIDADAWIGLYSNNSVLLWSSDQNLFDPFQFSNWFNNAVIDTPANICVSVAGSELYLGEWDARNCQNALTAFICERPASNLELPTNPPVTITTPSAKCGPGWIERPNSNDCYMINTRVSIQIGAATDCWLENGLLLSIGSAEEQLFIQNLVNSVSNIDSFWLGASNDIPSKGWRWTDNSAFVYTNWADDYYQTGPNEFCAVVSKQLNGGEWRTLECDAQHASICKKTAPGLGPIQTMTTGLPTQPGVNYGCTEPGWKYGPTNYCYKYFSDLDDHKTFDDAKFACRSQKADLVEVYSQYETEFMISLLKTRENPDTEKKNSSAKNVISCPSTWSLGPNNKCYKVSNEKYNDWAMSQNVCKRLGGTLPKISDAKDVDFIAEMIKKDIWIGLKRPSSVATWSWTDDTIANDQFTYWEAGYPSQISLIEKCAVMKASGSKRWIDTECLSDNSYDFICQRDATVQDRCNLYISGTTGEGGQCIHRDQCPDNLHVSGLCDGEATDFTITCCLTTSRAKEALWIGMYREASGINQNSYKWLSNNLATYSNWAPSQPNRNGQCTSFYVSDSTLSNYKHAAGQWGVTPCNYKQSYICKRPAERIQSTTTPNVPGCQPGYSAYENKCFYTDLTPFSWDDADSFCHQSITGGNGTLASINDQYVQYWLTTQFLSGNGIRWIGLRRNGNTFSWSSKEPNTYANWNKTKPDSSGDCVAMLPNGFWANMDCNLKYPSICMNLNSLMTPPPTTTTPPPVKCPNGWTEAGGRCGKMFGTLTTERIDWYQAEAYCNLVGGGTGHLSSFGDSVEFTTLTNGQNIYSFLSSDPGFWIGLNILDRDKGFQWTDGKPIVYFNWDNNQPDDFNGAESCVETKATGKWRDSNCFARKPFFCTIEKGIEPVPVSVTPGSNITTQPCPGNDGKYNWTLFNDKCYYVANPSNLEKYTWEKARTFCKQIGGDLLSIHTRKEADYALSIGNKVAERWWIGLYQPTPTAAFVWSDGSPLNFINWASGEPSGGNGGENCVEMFGSNSFWNDANCGIQMGFICEKSNRTAPPLEEVVMPLSFSSGDGNPCPSGYSTFGVLTDSPNGEHCVFPFKYKGNYYYECITLDRGVPWCATTADYDKDQKWGSCINIKCFKLVKTSKNYNEARKTCEAESATLASVNNLYEQAYLTSVLKSISTVSSLSVWLGLWCPGGWTQNSFFWDDNSDLVYTSFAPGSPGSVILNDKCVAMSLKKDRAGLWENMDCNRANYFFCTKKPNGIEYRTACENYFDVNPVPDKLDIKCPAGKTVAVVKADFGRQAYTMTCDNQYYFYSRDCSSVDSTTTKARAACDGANACTLKASVSEFGDPCPEVTKQLKVWYQCIDSPVLTTGGNSNGAPCFFPFKYKGILHHQCTFETIDGVINDKRWCCTGSDCSASLKWGVCPEATSPLLSSDCKKNGYKSVDGGNNCYKLVNDLELTWYEANQHCRNDQAELASVRDGFDQSFVRLIAAIYQRSPWVGFIKNNTNQFYWSDNWPVEYTNWGPNIPDLNTPEEKCAFMDGASGLWNVSACSTKKSFVCKVSNEPIPVVTTKAPGDCPNTSWKEFGSNCYQVNTLMKTQPEAKYDCYRQVSSLMSIRSQEEKMFVESLLANGLAGKAVWIGLEKNPSSEVYEWNDGSPLNFESYSSLFKGTKDCVQTLNGEWYDVDCILTRLPYVCKREKIVTTVSSFTTTTETTTTTTELTTTTTATTSTTTTTPVISQTTTTTTTTAAPTTTTTTETATTTTTPQTPQPTTTTVSVTITTPSIELTKKPKISGGGIFGIILAVVVAVAISVIAGLMILRNKGLIAYQLPFHQRVMSLLRPRSGSNEQLTYKTNTEKITINEASSATTPKY